MRSFGCLTADAVTTGWLVVFFLAPGCTAGVTNPNAVGAGGTGTQPVPTADAQGNLPYAAPQPAQAGVPARAWRLTHVEYRNTVKNLLGIDVDTVNFEAETDGGLFANFSNVNFVRVQLASSYYDTAEQVATSLTDAQLASLAAPCALLGPSCKAAFVRTVLGRAYRRPPSAEEIAESGATFDAAMSLGDPSLPFRAVVQEVLTSPFFLYRTELGAVADMANPSFRVTNHEVASLLSYSLLEQPPNAALLAAADRGELANLTSLKARVDELLATPEAQKPLQTFLFQWLTLNHFNDDMFKFPALYPGFDGVRAPMIEEAMTFLSVNGGMGGSISRLLTAPVPAAAGPLGAFYTAPGAGAGTRTGWLALGGFLSVAAHADQSSPTLRGNFIRERLLCQHMTVPSDIPNLTDVEATAMPRSTRELYELHQKNALCVGCHNALDQIGFTFEDFDGAGRFRTNELFRNQTVPVAVNTAGRLINTDVNRPLANHTDLAQALAESAWVRECAAIQTFRYYFGHGGEVPRGLPPVMAGYQAIAGGGTLKDLVAAVMSSPSTVERIRN